MRSDLCVISQRSKLDTWQRLIDADVVIVAIKLRLARDALPKTLGILPSSVRLQPEGQLTDEENPSQAWIKCRYRSKQISGTPTVLLYI